MELTEAYGVFRSMKASGIVLVITLVANIAVHLGIWARALCKKLKIGCSENFNWAGTILVAVILLWASFLFWACSNFWGK